MNSQMAAPPVQPYLSEEAVAQSFELNTLFAKSHGVVTEYSRTNKYKLQTMIDQRVVCIAKNYRVDEATHADMFSDKNKRSVLEIDAKDADPINQGPIFMDFRDPQKQPKQQAKVNP